MNMMRDEENAKYRSVIKNTIEFDPDILKRYVNFMSNPDERTAIDQFGNGDKCFGVATMMAALPGLPTVDCMTSSHHEAFSPCDPGAVREGRPPDRLISIDDIRTLFKRPVRRLRTDPSRGIPRSRPGLPSIPALAGQRSRRLRGRPATRGGGTQDAADASTAGW